MPRTVALSDFDKYIQQYMDASGLSRPDVMKAIGKAGPHPMRSRGYGARSGDLTTKPGDQSTQYYENMPDIPTKKVTGPTTPAPPAPPPPTPDPGPVVPNPHTTAINNAVAAGQKYYQQAFKDLGIAPGAPTYDIAQRFTDALNAIGAKVPGTQNDVSSYYNYSDLFSKALNAATAAGRNAASGAYTALTPANWQQGYIADTADDPILNSILAQQRGDVKSTLDQQLARGRMSQGAYNYALGQLQGDLSSSAMSTLQSLGGGVLAKDRTKLGDIADAYNTAITNFKLGNNLDINKLKSDLQTSVGASTGSLRGDILSALGGTKLFDPNALIGKAGSVSGPSNQPLAAGSPQGTAYLSAEDPDKRSTGTTGVF